MSSFEKSLAKVVASDAGVADEVITRNCYRVQPNEFTGRCVIDVGAHVGAFTHHAINTGQAMVVIAVEPGFSNFNSLVENVGNLPGAVFHRMALSDGSLPIMHIPENGHDSAAVAPTTPVDKRYLVPTTTLKQLVHRQLPCPPFWQKGFVLKIDCEGEEFKILWGAGRDLLNMFDIVMMEVHGFAMPDVPNACQAMRKFMELMGFKTVFFDQMFKWQLKEGKVMSETPIDAWIGKFVR